MDRILFGDNQFFGISHLSESRARDQAIKFRDLSAIINVLDYTYDIGLRTFMCTTHDRIWKLCDHIRAHPDSYRGYKIYPCMPYAHKYANAVTELGYLGTLKQYLPKNLLSAMGSGAAAFVNRDYTKFMQLLVDTEMKMFDGIETPVIFLQNVVTDLLLGLGATDFFSAFADHVKDRYGAEAGFITMNMPRLLDELEKLNINNPIVCASINKVEFRMSGGIQAYEQALQNKPCRAIAMQVLAAGAIPASEALEYVSNLKEIDSILFGASTPSHILQTKNLIEKFSKNTPS
jgi:hypothetical protein